jgi:hypothetical protein
MGQRYPELDERLRDFISRQSVFFVATAPRLSDDGTGGHVNISPKGYRDTFIVIGPQTVAYLDLTGSGAETVAHLRQNGRITIMFCSFARRPRILRLYGTGRVVLPSSPQWDELACHFAYECEGAGRAIIVVDVELIADSCGHGVPVLELTSEREVLTSWARHKTPQGLADYRAENNAVSIDGLPALDPP